MTRSNWPCLLRCVQKLMPSGLKVTQVTESVWSRTTKVTVFFHLTKGGPCYEYTVGKGPTAEAAWADVMTKMWRRWYDNPLSMEST